MIEDNQFSMYAAGYFDGEGCIRVTTNKDTTSGIHVFITNTYKPILDKFKEEYGGKVSKRNNANDRHKAQYQWRISNKKEALAFLLTVLPYLQEKREQAELGIVYCELPDLRVNKHTIEKESVIKQKQYRMEIAENLKELKHRRVLYD